MEDSEPKIVSPLLLVGAFAALSIGYYIVQAFYKVWFGPLSHVPGPRINNFSSIPYVRMLLSGKTIPELVRLHEKYGEVVRISPREVSFTSAETAFPDIYGFRTGRLKGHANMQKDADWYGPPVQGVDSILRADDPNHARVRKVLAHAFSERALAAQEPLVQDYVDQLVAGLKRNVDQPVDMVKWYNWTTFDIITDLTFGEAIGSLKQGATHQYLTMVLDMIISHTVLQAIGMLPWLRPFRGVLMGSGHVPANRQGYISYVQSQVARRIDRIDDSDDSPRPDFMTEILAHNTKGKTAEDSTAPRSKLSRDEMNANASLLLTAGSETTATTLSGATYLLLRHPVVHQKLRAELRAEFDSYDAITLDRVNRLPYLIAVLTESLRYFPPVPAGFVRQVAKGGETISGVYIPAGTAVSVSHYAAYHSEDNFVDANMFVPERWLDDLDSGLVDAKTVEKYKHDRKTALQPFSFGPRACLGRNLAYAEMRLILAKVVWSFEMELMPEAEDWIERCKLLRLWIKPELTVRLRVAEGVAS